VLSLTPLPAFTDNYIWVLHNTESALVVDPGDAAVVLDFLAARKLSLAAILVTHHHPDHTGGLNLLAAQCQGPIVAPAKEQARTAGANRWVAQGDTIPVLGVVWRVIEVPGHTAGHVAYVGETPGAAPILMCGDTLFSAGCGRLFEGTAHDMHHSLSQLAALPDHTQVCCAHEYTLSNLRFALAVEPDNRDIQAHQRRCLALRQRNLPTLPSSIELEKSINPFLRTHHLPVQQAAGVFAGHLPCAGADTLAVLREWKNQF
jgi:hydroxyacylglutathione hydrolase